LIKYSSGGRNYIAQYGEYGIRITRRDHGGGPYTVNADGLNDTMIEQAIKTVAESGEFTPENYDIKSNNCHDFTDAVMSEYKSIFIQKEMGKETGLLSRIKAELSWREHKSEFETQAGRTVESP
jgi:hypothetical protein